VARTTVDLRYILTDEGMRYDLYSPARHIKAHILLPEGRECRELLLGGESVPFTVSTVGESLYVDFECSADGYIRIEVLF